MKRQIAAVGALVVIAIGAAGFLILKRPPRVSARALAALCPGRADRIPQVQYRRLNELLRPRVLVVRGRVTEVRPMVAFAANGKELAWDSPRAGWRTGQLSVLTGESFYGHPVRRDIVVEVRLPGGSAQAAEEALRELRGLEAVWVFDDSRQIIDPLPPIFYDPLDDGQLIFPVSAGGRLGLTCPATEYPPGVLAGTRTLAELRAAARRVRAREWKNQSLVGPGPEHEASLQELRAAADDLQAGTP